METISPMIPQEKRGRISTLEKVEGGYIEREQWGRESFIPDSLVITRKSGKRYINTGLETGPGFEIYTVRSLDTGESREMGLEEFKSFINS